jgi:hypothetical protein
MCRNEKTGGNRTERGAGDAQRKRISAPFDAASRG